MATIPLLKQGWKETIVCKVIELLSGFFFLTKVKLASKQSNSLQQLKCMIHTFQVTFLPSTARKFDSVIFFLYLKLILPKVYQMC